MSQEQCLFGVEERGRSPSAVALRPAAGEMGGRAPRGVEDAGGGVAPEMGAHAAAQRRLADQGRRDQ